ncbi:MAG TPA: hypothetical protein VMU42_06355 [Candidatus Sulfotelmatobacter sp.]|nr:hypothetical protein [Candidatus Sulfotelmatobacter sp.]
MKDDPGRTRLSFVTWRLIRAILHWSAPRLFHQPGSLAADKEANVLRTIAILSLALIASLAMAAGLPTTANARVFVGVGIGVPGPFYYPPPVYYAPPPVYYAPPPPVYYAPAPVVTYAPPPAPAAAPAPAPTSSNCRQYNGDATIDGANQPFYGTACLQSDGKWHIVNQ